LPAAQQPGASLVCHTLPTAMDWTRGLGGNWTGEQYEPLFTVSIAS
jgi:hypothetical protein